MVIRLARPDELPAIAALVRDPNVPLAAGRVWVGIGADGRVAAVLPLQLLWLAEPLVVAGANRSESARAAVGVYRAAESFIAGCATPVLPPRSLIAMTRSRRVRRWSERLGWFRLGQGAAWFVKHLRPSPRQER